MECARDAEEWKDNAKQDFGQQDIAKAKKWASSRPVVLKVGGIAPLRAILSGKEAVLNEGGIAPLRAILRGRMCVRLLQNRMETFNYS